MRKEYYNIISKYRWNKMKSQEIKKYYDYKNEFGTLPAFKEHLSKLEKEMRDKKNNRWDNKQWTFEKKNYKKIKLRRIRKAFEEACQIYNKYNDGLIVYHNDEGLSFRTSETYDYDYYSKSYGHPKKFTTGHLGVDLSKLNIRDIPYINIDGIINIEIRNKKNVGRYTFLHTKSLKRTRSGFELVEYYIAMTDNIAYHSTKNIKSAKKGLDRKIKKLNDDKKPLSLSTIITRTKYRQLTGACNAGINEFLVSTGLSNRKSMLLADLLPLLEEKRAYGVNKIKSLLQ